MQRAAAQDGQPVWHMSFKGVLDLAVASHESFRTHAGRPRNRAVAFANMLETRRARPIPFTMTSPISSVSELGDVALKYTLRSACSRKPRGKIGGGYRQLLSDSREAGFDRVEDDLDALVVGSEGALDRIERELFQIGQTQVEQSGGEFGFLGHRGVAHEPVVGVEANAEAAAEEHAEGMLLKTRAGTGVEVAYQAHFQGHATVQNILRERAELEAAIGEDRDVIAQPRGMSKAMGSAVLKRLPD